MSITVYLSFADQGNKFPFSICSKKRKLPFFVYVYIEMAAYIYTYIYIYIRVCVYVCIYIQYIYIDVDIDIDLSIDECLLIRLVRLQRDNQFFVSSSKTGKLQTSSCV